MATPFEDWMNKKQIPYSRGPAHLRGADHPTPNAKRAELLLVIDGLEDEHLMTLFVVAEALAIRQATTTETSR